MGGRIGWQSAFLVSGLALLATCARGEPSERQRIVFFGDSITRAGERPHGYVSLLREVARRLDRPVELMNAGISGNKVTDLLARLDADVLSKRPHQVVIYVGINDVWHWFIPGLHGTPLDEYRKALRKIVETLKSQGSAVILCTPSVIGEDVRAQTEENQKLEAYSQVVRELAKEKSLPLVDLRRRFVEELEAKNPRGLPQGILTDDRVHLTADGNRLVATAMLDVLGWARTERMERKEKN